MLRDLSTFFGSSARRVFLVFVRNMETMIKKLDRMSLYHVQLQDWPISSPLQVQPWGLSDFRTIDPDGYSLRLTSRKTLQARLRARACGAGGRFAVIADVGRQWRLFTNWLFSGIRRDES